MDPFMTRRVTENDPPAKPRCPHCRKTSNVIKTGFRETRSGPNQRYRCRACRRSFTGRPVKNIMYPPEVISNAMTLYNLGYTKPEVAGILSRKYRVRVPVQTIHSWTRRYQDICTFIKIRKKYTLDPKNTIKSKKLHHVQVYDFKFHDLKLNFAARKFPEIRRYVKDMFDSCPNRLFKAESPRCSSLRINIKPKKAIKNNNAPRLAQFGLLLASTNKQRHGSVQNFMLVNDSATVTTELPVFLQPGEITNSERQSLGIEITEPLTGHIDILQARFNQIHVLDYKPDVKKADRRAAEQVFLYTLALSKRTNIPLENFICAYFDDRNYYQFRPITE